MAIVTTNTNVKVEDGWTLVATAVTTFLYVSAHTMHTWFIYVGATLPGPDIQGVKMYKRPFSASQGVAGGNVYVKINEHVQPQPNPGMTFDVIAGSA